MSDPIDIVIYEIITARDCGIVSCAIAARDDTDHLPRHFFVAVQLYVPRGVSIVPDILLGDSIMPV
jgi:hypothetical protein